MWELACLRLRWVSKANIDWLAAIAGKPAPTLTCFTVALALGHTSNNDSAAQGSTP
ncbi:hypothetical protein METHPM2_240046 [Pseudomonas sp. PM2]